MLEKKPINCTEKELVKYKDKENFTSFQISQLYTTNFDRKTGISTIRLLLAATLPVPFTSLLPTFGPSAQAPVNIPIYLIQPPYTELIATTEYM